MPDRALIAFGFAGVQVASGLILWAIDGPDWKKFCAAKGATALVMAAFGAACWLFQ